MALVKKGPFFMAFYSHKIVITFMAFYDCVVRTNPVYIYKYQFHKIEFLRHALTLKRPDD